MLTLLEQLLAIQVSNLRAALDAAAQLVAEAFTAEKADVLFYEPASDTLVALGTSNTALGRKQHALGLDRIPIADGGRAVQAFTTGLAHRSGNMRADPEELRALVEDLGLQSEMVVPLQVGSERGGVLLVSCSEPDCFVETDLRFLEVVARWVGILAHNAVLAARVALISNEQARLDGVRLAGRTAQHELNNQLGIAVGFADLLASDPSLSDEQRGWATDALQGAQRAAERLHQLQHVSELQTADEGGPAGAFLDLRHSTHGAAQGQDTTADEEDLEC